MHEVRYLLRRLARRPHLWILPAVTLALAIGGGGALLSLFNAYMVRELAVPRAGQLVTVYPGIGGAMLGIPLRTVAELRHRQEVVENLCGHARITLNVEIGGAYAPYQGEMMTGNCYPMLGVQPFLGRLFDERDVPELAAPSPVAVISHDFWTRSFGQDPAIVGQTVHVESTPVTIVGVLPPDFSGLDIDRAPDIIIPLTMAAASQGLDPGVALAIQTLGRLREGTTLEAARAEIRRIWPDVWAATTPLPAGQQLPPAADPGNLHVESIARGLSEQRVYGVALARLLGLSALLLLLACLNVGGVLLARTMARDTELAIRAALGASRARLAALVSGEAVVMAMAAALVAIPMAWWISQSLVTAVWIRITPTTLDAAPDAAVLAAIGAAGLAAGLIVSLPVVVLIAGRRWRLDPSVRDTPRTATVWRRAFIAGQVAVSLVLVFCAVLFVRNLAAIRSIDPGFDPDGVRWTRLELVYGQDRGIDSAAYFRPILEQLASHPAVDGAALSVGFPTIERRQVTAVAPYRPAGDGPEVRSLSGAVSPGFFAALGVRLLEGREFTWSDGPGQPPVVVVNRAFASSAFPDGGAVGATVESAPPRQMTFTIVGVVENSSPGDVRFRDIPMVYPSLLQNPLQLVAPRLIVQARTVDGLDEAVRGAIEPLGRHRVSGLQTLDDQADRVHMRERLLRGVSLAFAGLSLLVGGLGLYALLTHMVAGRTRDWGVRRALGATGPGIVSVVVREGLSLVVVGLALGLPLALAAARLSEPLLSDFPAHDPVSYGLSLALPLGVSAVACAWPALRAMRIAPAQALRHE